MTRVGISCTVILILHYIAFIYIKLKRIAAAILAAIYTTVQYINYSALAVNLRLEQRGQQAPLRRLQCHAL